MSIRQKKTILLAAIKAAPEKKLASELEIAKELLDIELITSGEYAAIRTKLVGI